MRDVSDKKLPTGDRTLTDDEITRLSTATPAEFEMMSRTSMTEADMGPARQMEPGGLDPDGINPTLPVQVNDSNTQEFASERPEHTLQTISGRESELESRIQLQIEEREARGARVRKDPLIGRVFAERYEIVSKIGAGGMGVVYKARQIGMDRHVAIKVLLKEYLDNETAVRRFQREALAVSKLQHPNTVRIFDFGETTDHILYIAMEFLPGAPLQRMLDRHEYLPVRVTLRIVQQICHSLNEAHLKGIIHRDLKPDNVFVGAIEGQDDFVKVLDFGVAKLRETTDGGTLTQHGTIFGTPKYMSPEQCKSQEVDARSDLYSVGIMMYEMLSGRVPFESENPLAILIMHAQDPVQALVDVRPNLVIPAEVEEFLHRLLEKDAMHRPESAKHAADLAAELLSQVPEDFEQVWTYDEASEKGKPYVPSGAYTVKSRLSASQHGRLHAAPAQDQITMHVEGIPDLPRPGIPKWMAITMTFLVACLGLLGFAWSQVKGVPAESQGVIPIDALPGELAELPPLAGDMVAVTFSANVDNVTIVEAESGDIIGQLAKADEPQEFRWLREEGRMVRVQLRYAEAAPVDVAIDLAKDRVVPQVLFDTGGQESVALTLKTNVGGVLVSVEGVPHTWVIPETGPAVQRAAIPKGDKPLRVTFKKAGYITMEQAWTPDAEGELIINLVEDPNAVAAPTVQPAEVTITIAPWDASVNVVGTTMNFAWASKRDKGKPLTFQLPRSDDEVTLEITRRGYNTETRTLTPNQPAIALTVSLEKKKRQAGTTNASDPGGKTPKEEPKLISPIKKKEPASPRPGRLNRLKRGP